MIKHIIRWFYWRKRSLNSPFYKFMVLIGFIKSPTMAFTITPKDAKAITKAFEEGMKSAERGINGR